VAVNRYTETGLGEGSSSGSAVDPALLEGIEVRAFGVLVEEVVERVLSTARGPATSILERLAIDCLNEDVSKRPTFAELEVAMASLEELPSRDSER
jgi:hypothetical protein